MAAEQNGNSAVSESPYARHAREQADLDAAEKLDTQKVKVTGIDLPWGEVFSLTLKVMVCTIPAALIIGFCTFFLWVSILASLRQAL